MFKKLFLFLFLFGFSLIAVAIDVEPVNRVYRVDSRNPEEIFQNGFTSWGNNDNIVAHITGDSCVSTDASPAPNSAFVATTSDWDWASDTAISMAFSDDQTMYLYEIVPTQQFYSAALSLENYEVLHPEQHIPQSAHLFSEGEHEWLAHGGIAARQIRTAYIFIPPSGDDEEPTIALYGNNFNYDPEPVQESSSNPYQTSLSISEAVHISVALTAQSPNPIYGPCFAPGGASNSSSKSYQGTGFIPITALLF